MTGEVVAMHIAGEAGAAMRALAEARATAGAGLEGDRYRKSIGFYSGRSGDGRQLTLIEGEALEAVAAEAGIVLEAGESRRNVTTRGVRLNDLVGKRFAVGEVVCRGVRLCPPCTHLEELTGKPVLRPLIDRGGLRADILVGGTIRVGDAVREVE